MKSSALAEHTLVLNKTYSAVDIKTVREAISDIVCGTAIAIDEHYNEHDWDSWMELPYDGRFEYIKSGREMLVRAPRVIKTLAYESVPVFDIKLNMRNLWIRDGGRCQYSGRKLSLSEATKDHVKPKSRKGPDNWTNLVTCCPNVNHQKGDKTPGEAGLTLMTKPKKPKWTPLFGAACNIRRIHDEWLCWLPHLRKQKEAHGR